MNELWDIYDANRNKTGRMAERDVYEFKQGEYHIVVTAIIINSKNEILITKRAPHKNHALMWECNGGSVLAGETSLEGILRELKEELGVIFYEKDAKFLKTVKKSIYFKDIWIFRKDILLKDIVFQDGETIDAQWVTIDKFIEMYNNKKIITKIEMEDYEKALKL